MRSFLPTLSSRATIFSKRLLGLLAEGPLVIDDRPGFIFRDGSRNQGDHPSSCTAVLDNPEELAIFPLPVELAVREIRRELP